MEHLKSLISKLRRLEEIEYLKQYIFNVYSKKIIGKTSLQKEEIINFIEKEVP